MKYVFWRIIFAFALVFAFEGCLLEHAPSGPSRNINTWLLGIWVHEDADGSSRKVWMMPVSSDRYALYFQEYNSEGKVKETKRYEAWISRIGQASLLTIVINEGGVKRYLALGYQLLSPIEVRIRRLALPPEAEAYNGFRLRAQIRQQFKDGTLYAREDSIWTKVSEIYWQKEGDPTQQPFQQLQNVSSIPLKDIATKERP